VVDDAGRNLVGDHYVARTGVDSQQTDLDADPDAPFDLWQPVDGAGGKDHGARGIFSDSEGGMLTRQWVASVPRIAVDAALATVDRAREVIRKR
jgi:hypothetical protein